MGRRGNQNDGDGTQADENPGNPNCSRSGCGHMKSNHNRNGECNVEIVDIDPAPFLRSSRWCGCTSFQGS